MSLFRCDWRDQIKLEHFQQITSTQAQQITAAGIRTSLDGKKKASKHLYTITFVPFSSVCLLLATVPLATCAGRLVSLYSSYDSHTHRLISSPADTWSRLWGRISGACRVFCSGCLNSSVSFKTQTNKNLVPPPVSAERVVSGGGEYPGCSDFTKPQRLLPSHDARRLRAAGGQRVVRSETCVRVKLSLYVSVSVCKTYRSLIWRCSHCFLSCPAATSQARSAWRLSAEWTAWPAAFPACSALWRSTTSCSSCT